jgi:AGCS family alanine or glycine:cation symporter
MKKSTAGLLTFAIIIVVLIVGGIEFFDSVWSFPGNFEFFKTFPTADLPLGVIPLMIIVLVGTGIFVTIKLALPQIRYLWHGIKVTMGKYDNPEDEGDLNHFRALTTALSATVGIGNIAGVATAIYYGGPGAIFWMWITAFFGTTLKYAEATLAVEYRELDDEGHTAGGPMYTIERGLGKNWRWLAVAFACFAIICSFATGNAIQSFTVSDQVYSETVQLLGANHFLTIKHLIFGSFQVSVQQVINGIILSAIVGVVIIGGIKRIGRVTGFLAPIMAVIYTVSAFLIILFNYASAAIAHSTAKTKFAVREGSVAMLGPFIDTIIICTLTGLVIIVTNAWHHTQFFVTRINPDFTGELLNSSLLTSFAFKEGLSWLTSYGDKIVTVSVLLFAVSTAISWSFYGDRSAHYLFGKKAILPYKWVFVLFVFIGAIAELEAVWAFGDAALGFMTFPNLLAIILLSGVLKKMTKKYFSIKHKEYKKK